LVLTQGAVNAPILGFHTSDEKEAFLAGFVVGPSILAVSPPAVDGYPIIAASDAVALLRSTGTGHAPTPLRVTSVRLAAGSFATDRGLMLLPAWLLTFDGVSNPASVLAVVPSLQFRIPAASGQATAMMSATISADGRTLTVSFVGSQAGTGPCTADYAASAAESVHAVAIVINEVRSANSGGGSCAAVGYVRRAAVQLRSPLGERVVVDARSDTPVAVG